MGWIPSLDPTDVDERQERSVTAIPAHIPPLRPSSDPNLVPLSDQVGWLCEEARQSCWVSSAWIRLERSVASERTFHSMAAHEIPQLIPLPPIPSWMRLPALPPLCLPLVIPTLEDANNVLSLWLSRPPPSPPHSPTHFSKFKQARWATGPAPPDTWMQRYKEDFELKEAFQQQVTLPSCSNGLCAPMPSICAALLYGIKPSKLRCASAMPVHALCPSWLAVPAKDVIFLGVEFDWWQYDVIDDAIVPDDGGWAQTAGWGLNIGWVSGGEGWSSGADCRDAADEDEAVPPTHSGWFLPPGPQLAPRHVLG
ncbi:hypothetical protein MVEN_01437700 [Mycena venus]|uniref:Uncharacterized protein n=1 Tax=Mycena venus TaxID=2733690 RepID=A0A8H6XYM4_9AGAR|nr:hypothetical protein MVEN_01437700 [Mycena venus]